MDRNKRAKAGENTSASQNGGNVGRYIQVNQSAETYQFEVPKLQLLLLSSLEVAVSW
jgi:hypothetical protein